MAPNRNGRRFANLSYQDIAKLSEDQFRLWQYEQTLENENAHREILRLVKVMGTKIEDFPGNCPYKSQLDKLPEIERKTSIIMRCVDRKKQEKKSQDYSRKKLLTYVVIWSGILTIIATILHSLKDGILALLAG